MFAKKSIGIIAIRKPILLTAISDERADDKVESKRLFFNASAMLRSQKIECVNTSLGFDLYVLWEGLG